MFKDIKIAFFDLDGTLANSDGLISDDNAKALKLLKEMGIKNVLSTGRCFKYLFKYDISIFDYIICNNGACVIDCNNKKVIYEEVLSDEYIKIITDYCDKYNHELIFNGLNDQYSKDNISSNDNMYQAIVFVKEKEEVKELINYVQMYNLKVTYISSAYYKPGKFKKYTTNINLKDTDKGKTISLLLKSLNIDKNQSICFGDNFNDLTMFENCNIKVAMDNGLKELKDKADFITSSNDLNGVAHFIFNNINNN